MDHNDKKGWLVNTAVKTTLGMKNNFRVNVKMYFKILRVCIHVHIQANPPFPPTLFNLQLNLQ